MIRVGGVSSASPCLAIDIGATKVDVAIVEPDGEIHDRHRIVVAEHPDHLIESILSVAVDLQLSSKVHIVGVGCAGPMVRWGDLVSPLNIPQWREFPLRQRLKDDLGDLVSIEGDARAFALAEGYFGGARDINTYLSMVVSTGIGGALVMDGRLLDGDSGNAGHIGHLNVVPDGALCSCGSFGCLEAEVSGWAIEARTGRPPSMAGTETRDRCADLVGRAVGTMSSVLDFSHCYIAGSVALGYGADFFARANKAARSLATMHYSRALELMPSGVGPDGPLLGAAVVGWASRL